MGIPEADGVTRPLSVAAEAWRVGMAIIVRKLADWTDGWAPEEIIGGLRHRQAAVIGAKLDLKKCFDSVAPFRRFTAGNDWVLLLRWGEDSEGFLSITAGMGRV